MSHRRLVDLVDYLIPHSIWRTQPDATTVARARTLVAVLVFAMVLPVVCLLLVVILQFFTSSDFTPGIVSLVGIIVLLVLQHLWFQKKADLYLAGLVFSITCFVALITSTALTGGWYSPVIPLLFCSPVIVFLISGLREGEYAVLGNFATGIIFMMLDVLHVDLPNLMHEANRPYAQGVVWFLACVILVLQFATQKWLQGLEREKSVN